jgi:hypothetical protein
MDNNFEYFYTCISVPNPKIPALTIPFFVTMNVSQKKVLIFNEGGILKRQIDYSE